tara:strand:- start:689 stop:1081 length:393 start_codon:yes stop_codon:yes gene_type:complete
MNNIEKSAQLLLDDKEFINDVKTHIGNISNDNKIDFSDIISIISLVATLVRNKKIYFDISKKDISEVFRLIIIKILNENNIYEKLKNNSNLNDLQIEKKIENIINDLLTILITQIKTTSFLKKLLKKCKC